MSLADYRAKRDFGRTPEPAGSGAPDSAVEARFVVQHHRARRDHYDFRLEVGGVLASWAMPKGPSLDPAVKALAVRVEDHPIEYRDFEGVIPAGQYGGGDVIVWDRGTWRPARSDDPAVAIGDGELHFDLFGEKLRGRFVLVRTRRQGEREQWLMLHKRDSQAVAGWRPGDHPRSVKSGRTNQEVALSPSSVWHSDRPASEAEVRLGWDPPSPDELEALDRMGSGGSWRLQGRTLRLTNLDKEIFPGKKDIPAVTKRDLIRYYVSVAPAMLPGLAGRPVNLHRFPDGAARPGFWHNQPPPYAPEWITRWQAHFVVDSVPALAWMANYAAVELHPWTSMIPDVDGPTWALVDIDPGLATSPQEVRLLARLFRDGLGHLGVAAAAKVTGQRGIHIWIPVAHGYTFSDTSAWVEKLSRAVGATVPDLVSWTWQKDARGGKARLDYTQNARNKTLVAPYSARPAPGAPVSAPIRWEDLDDPSLRSDAWTIRTMPARLAEVGDLFAGLAGRAQRLPEL